MFFLRSKLRPEEGYSIPKSLFSSSPNNTVGPVKDITKYLHLLYINWYVHEVNFTKVSNYLFPNSIHLSGGAYLKHANFQGSREENFPPSLLKARNRYSFKKLLHSTMKVVNGNWVNRNIQEKKIYYTTSQDLDQLSLKTKQLIGPLAKHGFFFSELEDFMPFKCVVKRGQARRVLPF